MSLIEAIEMIDQDERATLYVDGERVWTGQIKTLEKRFGVLQISGAEKLLPVKLERDKFILRITRK